jgi:hypothetical protein
MTGAVVRYEQLVHNTLYSGTRSGQTASGRRTGRVALLAHRFALLQKVRLSAQFARSENDNVSRLRVEWTTPRADALSWYSKAVLSPCWMRTGRKSALAGASRQVLGVSIERTKRPVYPKGSASNETWR